MNNFWLVFISIFSILSVYKFDEIKNQVQDPKPRDESWFPCYNFQDPYASCVNRFSARPDQASQYHNNKHHRPHGK